MSTASRDTLLQVFQDQTNRILTPVVDKIINHSTKGVGFDILRLKDIKILDLKHSQKPPTIQSKSVK